MSDFVSHIKTETSHVALETTWDGEQKQKLKRQIYYANLLSINNGIWYELNNYLTFCNTYYTNVFLTQICYQYPHKTVLKTSLGRVQKNINFTLMYKRQK